MSGDIRIVAVEVDDAEVVRNRALRLAEAGAPLSAQEMAAIFREGLSNFYKKVHLRVYDAFKLNPVTGPKCWSGALVHRHLHKLPLYESSFGQRRAAR